MMTNETDSAAWLAGLKKGDRVMIASEFSTKVRTSTIISCYQQARIYVGGKSFSREDGICKQYSLKLIPYDPAIAKDQRQRNKALKQIGETAWHTLPTETLIAIAALLPEVPSAD